MLKKTIRQILVKKINNWIETVTDESLRKEMRDGVVVTGGCFASMIMNEEPKDFDVYFNSKELTLKVANYYAGLWNASIYKGRVYVIDGAYISDEILELYGISREYFESEGAKIPGALKNCPAERIKMFVRSKGVVGDIDSINSDNELGANTASIIGELDEKKADEIINKEKKEYFPVFISTNAITLSNGIQIVVRFYGKPDKIHETYDFAHTKAYFTFKTDVVIPNEVYEYVINKTLVYTGSKYPVCSIFRMRKFIERGWRINVGQILKMIMQCNQLDLYNIDTLEDQLIGVDSLYFMNLLNQFRKMKENDEEFELTPSYIISIIDKIF
jgi:hypothetical protein